MINIRKKRPLLALMVILSIVSSCSKAPSSGYRIEHGDFAQSITETGELAAVNAKAFIMPRYGRYWYEMKIIGLLDHGSSVKAGDSIIQLDPTEVKKFIIDRENQLETQRANLEKIIVEIANRKSDLNSSLRSQQASFNLKKLELEQYRFESDKTKSIKQLEFIQAQIRLEKVKQSLEFYEVISQNQLRIQQIQVARLEQDVQNAYDVLPDLTIRTPIPGIFQIATKRRSRDLLNIGDEVYMGTPLGSVPDLTWMKVKTVINEADFLKIEKGQTVNVRLDALPDVIFEGEVSFISKLCHPIEYNSRQKVFDIEVKILVSDERLKPGMTVSCEYVCTELKDVFYAPLSCIESINDQHFIYVQKGGNIKRQEVKVGPANNTSIVITGDIKKGQQLMPVNQITETQNN